MKYTDSQMDTINSFDRLELADAILPLLSIDGVPLEGPDVRDLVAGGSDGRVVEATDSEPAVQLTATVAGKIDPDGQEVRMDFLVGDTLLPGYVGRLREARTVPLGTEIEAQTSAYHWQRSPLNVDMEAVNTPRNLLAYSALSALSQQYAGIQIPRSIAEPPVSAAGSERLGAFDAISDAIDLVEGSDEAKICRILDTSLNVATAYPAKPVEASGAAVWEVREGEDCGYGEVEVSSVDEEYYYSVVVYRPLEDGSDEKLAEVRIDNGGRWVSTTDKLLIEYTEDEEDTGVAKESAFVMAFNEAMRRGANARKLTVPLVHWPIWLDRGDLVAVETREFTGQNPESGGERGSIYRRYLMRVEGYAWGPQRNEASLTGEGVLLSETFVSDEGIRPVADSPIADLLWGHDYRQRLRLSDSLPWAALIADDQGRRLVRLNATEAENHGVSITKEGSLIKVSK